eukprot:9503828-Pyramimonas_sp.AAC.3
MRSSLCQTSRERQKAEQDGHRSGRTIRLFEATLSLPRCCHGHKSPQALQEIREIKAELEAEAAATTQSKDKKGQKGQKGQKAEEPRRRLVIEESDDEDQGEDQDVTSELQERRAAGKPSTQGKQLPAHPTTSNAEATMKVFASLLHALHVPLSSQL